MLFLDLKRQFADLGIDDPHKFLRKKGFTRHTTRKLLYDKGGIIHFRHLEQLCLIFKTTPDNLLRWVAPSEEEHYKTHPLQKIKYQTNRENISSKIRRLNPEQLEELRTYLNSIESSKEK